MSRVGINPVIIEDGVTVEIKDSVLVAKGAKGENTVQIPENINVEIKDDQIVVSRKDESPSAKAMHGTVRSLVYNAVLGAKEGYSKKLEIHGVGYRVKMEGANLSLSLGWNHPVIVEAPEGIEYEVPNETEILVKGVSKQLVGEVAARIREMRKPEPYKGKGIRYSDEYVRRKSAKSIN